MNTSDIEQNVQRIFDHFVEDDFIFDLLLAYGISKTSITRLKKGDFNLSKIDGELLYRRKVFFKKEETSKLLSAIDALAKEQRILRHQPRFIILTDGDTLVAKDLKLTTTLDISIKELPKFFSFFLPLAGSEVYHSTNDNEADRNAAYKMAQLYDALVEGNKDIYNSKEGIHGLNVFLSRLLFCYFAEDTEIFDEESIFTDTLVQHTAGDGSDTHSFLGRLFQRLNTPDATVAADMPEYLSRFPYVNGGLFDKIIAAPHFTAKARKILIELGDLNWREINPDIFGSMIQAVVIPEYRSDLGMHYTSVPNILKLIKPLFLDDLYEELENSQTRNQLQKLLNRISKIKFLDPACGSGNFLIITYKELRRLEVEILKRLVEMEGDFLFLQTKIRLTQFYGIEIDDFAHEMAILSLWLAEHQMNQYFEHQLEGYTQHQSIIPLKKSGTIVQGNAARVDWKDICPIGKNDEVYVIGNPPYLGSRNQGKEQKDDMRFVFQKDYKSLDYVSIWFYKGAKYIEGRNAELAFVSTNSICQGLSVSLTWPRILNDNIEIGFAYQSFKWVNNAKRNAGVTVIILCLRNKSLKPKFIFTNNVRKEAKNINAYLLEGSNIIVGELTHPISSEFPKMNFGNMPADGGHLLFTEEERESFVNAEPLSEAWFKEIISAYEFLNGKKRYCLWLENISDSELNAMKNVKNRVSLVYNERIKSSRPKLAEIPHLFAQITQPPNSDFILIPRHSSEEREYIPMGYFSSDFKASDSTLIIGTAQPWLFGVIHSRMHMVWVRAVGGKLETRYRYSAKLCYNTFPFPDISVKQKETLNLYVFTILDERAKYPGKTMAWLYNSDTMPNGLRKAHEELDKAVEQCYRLQPFANDTERLEYLFRMYEKMVENKK